MAAGESSTCHIVPTRDSNIFRLRVRLPSSEDATPEVLASSTVVAGCSFHTFYWPACTRYSDMFGIIPTGPVLKADTKVSTHMVFLDKTGTPAPSIGTGFHVDGVLFLCAPREDLKSNCVVDNHFVVLCSVNIEHHSDPAIPPWAPPSSSAENELPHLAHNLAVLWGKQELTDVSFDVGGESLGAHRVVLATASAVFRAELYGPMAESNMASSITIQDMEASTFRSMLHYIYHGSLPDAGKIVVPSAVAEYQHLLVAADRYAVEKLKKICEDKLCADGITVDSVVSMLELAEQHVCSKLKARCFSFLADGDNFKVVATSGEYLRLMQSFPNLLAEARDMFKIPHEKPTIVDPGSHKKTRLC
ncbi:BTB/POZ and MATH domain-containing protein 3-like [Lolium rigidum]|uniref:BTB/POZ and MATH domain-containing protein 3-like n=1 Tax=Lolium rigidum TaxID=89674 RepID=UPI001F5DBC3D|nr:BTB/POZ and MATH domain-containing protein 3-like [Lolium rigidum]